MSYWKNTVLFVCFWSLQLHLNKLYGEELECYVYCKSLRDYRLVRDSTHFPPWCVTLTCTGVFFATMVSVYQHRISTVEWSCALHIMCKCYVVIAFTVLLLSGGWMRCVFSLCVTRAMLWLHSQYYSLVEVGCVACSPCVSLVLCYGWFRFALSKIEIMIIIVFVYYYYYCFSFHMLLMLLMLLLSLIYYHYCRSLYICAWFGLVIALLMVFLKNALMCI